MYNQSFSSSGYELPKHFESSNFPINKYNFFVDCETLPIDYSITGRYKRSVLRNIIQSGIKQSFADSNTFNLWQRQIDCSIKEKLPTCFARITPLQYLGHSEWLDHYRITVILCDLTTGLYNLFTIRMDCSFSLDSIVRMELEDS